MKERLEKFQEILARSIKPERKKEERKKLSSSFSSTLNDTCEEVKKMKRMAKMFCDHFISGSPPKWMVLLGPSELGKTHLAKEVWRYIVKNSHLLRSSPTGHPKTIRYSWSVLGELPNSQLTDDYEYMKMCRACYIDDLLNVGKDTPWIVERMGAMVDLLMGKWAIFTSNLSMSQFRDLDARVESRFRRGAEIDDDGRYFILELSATCPKYHDWKRANLNDLPI